MTTRVAEIIRRAPREWRPTTLHAISCAPDIAIDLLLVLAHHRGQWMGTRPSLAREIIAVNGGHRPEWMRDDPATIYLARGVRHAARLLWPDVYVRVIRPKGFRHRVVSMRALQLISP